MQSFDVQLRALRRSAGLSQQQLADRLGVDRSVYAMYESGKLIPAHRLFEAICSFFAVSSDVRCALAEAADA